ncbi:hypothetical protein [Nigerium massiliense]|uniref:hypothetical protein n=1 Tax=Nigerium massiliense TaxID=1522317 RepID=UPI00058C3469|nr:hypothetical protein [Nigerium massiliense]
MTPTFFDKLKGLVKPRADEASNETRDAAWEAHDERVRTERWRQGGYGPRGSWTDFARGNSTEFGPKQP